MNPTLAQLFLYPIKGCRGIELPAATLEPTGLAWAGVGDREWVVVDADGRFLSQRSHPRMALIAPSISANALLIDAPGMPRLPLPLSLHGTPTRVRVWDDEIAALEQGEANDAWFSRFLETPCRLARFDPAGRRLARAAYCGDLDAPYRFADAFPLLVTARDSLAEFNARLVSGGAAPIGIERFRPNLVLDGIDAYGEDYLDEIAIGAARLRVVKPCARCTVPGVDPATGVASDTVPDALARFRSRADGVMFGVNAILCAGAGFTLRAGAAVDTTIRF